jgi:hypothetical protein
MIGEAGEPPRGPTDGVVDDVRQLRSGWLSEALGVDVRTVRSEPIGAGQTGATYRLVLDTDGGPRSVVAKIAAGDDDARRRVAPGYRAEVGFYAELTPTVDVRAPTCWHASINDDATSFTLLMEDLAPRLPGVQVDGCSIAQAEGAIRNLAGLHAPRWNDESLFDLPFVSRPTEDRAAFLAGVAAAATDGFVARYEAELDRADVATLRAAADVIEAWSLAGLVTVAPIHGDYRLDNLLFGPDGTDVVAVDWQTLTVAPPGRDVAYFLGTSVEPAARRAAETDLVAAYHGELVRRGVGDYSFERCFDDYRIGQLQAPMITTIGCMYATAARSDSADRMFLAMARRACAAIRDLDALRAF